MRDTLNFYVNGSRHEIGDSRAIWTLAEFLRQEQRLVGTKIVCAEGDCGSCTVLVGQLDAESGRLVYQTVDSCIAFLYQLDRCHVVTVEGLKLNGALSPVQDAMVRCHGSQCGFCTPGFVVALHGLLEEQNGDTCRLEEDRLRYGLSGNLCRCTGYVQILDAAKAVDPAKVARIAELADQRAMLAEFKKLRKTSVLIEAARDGAEMLIAVPRTLQEAIAFRAAHPEAKIVCGATDVGVQRNLGRIDPVSVLYLGAIEALRRIEVDGERMVLGAGATWARIERAVEQVVPEYWQVLARFGSPQIRHLATIGGNFANASPIADSLPFHYVMESQVELAGPAGTRQVPIADFYQGYKRLDLAADELIAAIHTPLPAADESLKLYKVTKRRDMDISTVTAGIRFRQHGGNVHEPRFAVGGVAATVVRLPKAEAYAAGQPFTEATFRRAGQIARGEIRPISDVRGGAAYRLQLVENLFVKAFHELSLEPLAA
jgi:xanthine dehydrogenase small subunit